MKPKLKDTPYLQTSKVTQAYSDFTDKTESVGSSQDHKFNIIPLPAIVELQSISKIFETEQGQESYGRLTWLFLEVAIPSIICMVILFFQHLCNMIVAGHLGDVKLLAAIGQGNMI